MAEAAIPFVVNTVVLPFAATMALKQLEASLAPGLKDLGLTTSATGTALPLVYGRARVPGNVIWTDGLTGTGASGNKNKGSKGWSVNLAVALCQGPMQGLLAVRCNGERRYYRGDDATPREQSIANRWDADVLTFYLGDNAQTANSLMASVIGATYCPAYRGTSYVMLQDFNVSEWGRLPTMQFDVTSNCTIDGGTRLITPNAVTVQNVIIDLAERAGYSVGQIDVSDIGSSLTLDGYVVPASTTFRDALQPILSAFYLDAIEVAPDSIRVQPRAGAAVITVPSTDLAARPEGDADADPVQSVHTDVSVLPQSLTVTYNDSEGNLLRGGQRSMQDALPNGVDLEVHLGVSVTHDVAAQIADIGLAAVWWESVVYRFTLPWKYLYLEPGDRIVIPVSGEDTTVRLTRITVGANLLLECEAVRHDDDLYTSGHNGTFFYGGPGAAADAGTTYAIAWAGPALRDGEDSWTGFYIAAGGTSKAWKQAAIYTGLTNVGPWKRLYDNANDLLDRPCVMGYVSAGALAAHDANTWDDTSSVTITLRDPSLTLTSATDAQVLAGDNLAIVTVGSAYEYIQFGTVTPIGGGVYTLTHLLRGRKGTTPLTGGGEFALLDNAVLFYKLAHWANPADLYYKIVPNGYTLDEVGTNDFGSSTFQFGTLRPWPPVQISGVRDGSGNLTVTFTRRSRVGHELTDGADVPLGEEWEAYLIKVYSLGGGLPIVRRAKIGDAAAALRLSNDPYWQGTITFAADGRPTWYYSKANQDTDFGGGAHPSIVIEIAQLSAQAGPGYSTYATV